MPTVYQQMSSDDLAAALADLRAQVDAVRARGLKLDMARGKPSPAQVDISRPMLSLVDAASDLHDGSVDCGNYGCFEGIPSARALAAGFLGCPADQTLALGSSSLLIEYEALSIFWRAGTCGNAPWSAYSTAHEGRPVKILCPVPGYDRHFGISDDLGIENVPVPMTAEGPDMDEIERLAASDDAIKGIWCVPKYSNPTGVTYTEEVVRRLATMPTAAADFRILWDNAYCVHDLYDEGDELANIFEIAREAGTEDRMVAFASTSKITFPGAGIAFLGASPRVIAELSGHMKAGLISADKINQLRHARFLPDMDAVRAHMRRHAAHLRPRFELVERTLSAGLSGTGCATWSHPRGGYFVSFDGPAGSAKRIGALCAGMGPVRPSPVGMIPPTPISASPRATRMRTTLRLPWKCWCSRRVSPRRSWRGRSARERVQG